MNTDALLAERGATHGDYATHAAITQGLKAVFRANFVGKMYSDQWESVDMICHKLGRIAAGNAEFADHWDDIAGYAKLSADEVRKREDATKPTKFPKEIADNIMRFDTRLWEKIEDFAINYRGDKREWPSMDALREYVRALEEQNARS